MKYGSDAMAKTDPSKGKEASGGSIIMTASGMYGCCQIVYLIFSCISVAGIRSGAGPVDCKLVVKRIHYFLTIFQDSASKAA